MNSFELVGFSSRTISMLPYGWRRRLLVYDGWRRQVLDLKTRRCSFSDTLVTDSGFLIQIQAFWYRFVFILHYIWYRFRLLDKDSDILETHADIELRSNLIQGHAIWYRFVVILWSIQNYTVNVEESRQNEKNWSCEKFSVGWT